ncbi:MAG: c-type cytochrome [Gemmatimonadota bacterium]
MQAHIRNTVRGAILVVLAASAAACGGGEDPPGETETEGSDRPTASADGLTAEELEFGIGPIRSIELSELDHELAEEGAEVFSVKCSACHKLEERYVGPPLGDVTERRTPEFVMNMMLNPEEMVARHPEVKAMLAQYYTPMPDQQLSEQDARAVLEYLRAPADLDIDVEIDEQEARGGER